MSEPAVKLDAVVPAIRRYQTADIQRHAIWLFPRMAKFFPHMNQSQHYTWLLNVLGSNDFLPLYHDRGIAIAVMVSQPMRPNSHVEEIFVFVENPESVDDQTIGAHFYSHMQRWATQRGISTVFIENCTEVPRRLIADVGGMRVFETKQAYMRAR